MDFEKGFYRKLLIAVPIVSFLAIGFNHWFFNPHDNPSDQYSSFGPLLFPSQHPDHVILNLTESPLTSVAVNWRTDTTVKAGKVRVNEATHDALFAQNPREIRARSAAFENQFGTDPKVHAYYHSAIINDLRPGKKYVYQVGFEKAWSEWFQITVPKKNKAIKFIYFGDAQNNVKSLWSRVVREAYKTMPDVDFMLHAGDLINRFARDVEWGEWFYAGDFIHATIPSMMTPGNHEYFNHVLSPQWRKQFNLPENGPSGLEETCYQVNYDDLKVISLDAEQIDVSEIYRYAQAKWLDSILIHDSKKWNVVTLHYPLFSTKPDRDNPRLRALLKPIFDRHRVDLVLQGHDHAYGRGMVKNEFAGTNGQDPYSGTVYVVSISGPKMYEIGEKAWMTRRAGNTQLFQIITIDGNKLNYDAYTATGQLYDSFELIKRKNKTNSIIEKIPQVPLRLNR